MGKPISVTEGLIWPHGSFATFNPALDGLDRPIGDIWTADDCPVWFYKAGAGVTQWVVGGVGTESALIACGNAAAGVVQARVQALYQGAARTAPADDFTGLDMRPSHFLRPDLANNRFTDDVGGDHWTKQGGGVGALIQPSSQFGGSGPFGVQAHQDTQAPSFYMSPSVNTYNPGNQAEVIQLIAGILMNASGGIGIGKESGQQAAFPAARGRAISWNDFGGFGYEWAGDLGFLNKDTVFGTPPVDDGRLRLFSLYRSLLAGGRAGVRCVVATVEDAGLVGDVSAVDCNMGLVGQAPAVADLAYGTQAVLVVPMFLGVAAENVLAHIDAIEAFIQNQLPSAPVVGASSTTNVNPTTVLTVQPAPLYRPVTVPPAPMQPYTPSNYNSTMLCYAFNLNYGAAGIYRVVLYADPANVSPPVTPRAVCGGGTSLGPSIVDCQMSFLCPPTWTVAMQLEASPFGGGVAPTIVEQYATEESLRP
jgi:hypothetical protein